ncbi:MAG: T9SS type A sorting domain-containing protein [Bacteroidota bacterium]
MMLKRPVSFFWLLFLLTDLHPVFGQFSGGTADGHGNVRISNVVCVVINANPFVGGNGAGAAYNRKVNVTCTVVNANPYLGGAGQGTSGLSITNISCVTVNANPFLGGTGDGHADLNITNITCTPINANPFLGGNGDGHSDLSLINITCTVVNANPFLGGSGDGHTDLNLTNVICVPINANPFLGGTADGHAMASVQNVTCVPINVNPFLGGVADGHAFASLQNVTCVPINVNPFKGGIADGHADMRLINITCSIVNVNPFLGGIASGHSFKSLTNIMCGVSSLPIQLIFFQARADGSKVLLTWETAAEVNNDYFTIEKASPNMRFEKVLAMNGAGNSNHSSYYDAADPNPFNGVSYYRLKQTDFDGLYSYSQTEEINFEHQVTTSISPNPVTKDRDVTLSLESSNEEDVNLQIRDALGAVVYSFIKPVLKGENKFLLKLPLLHSGIYFLDISSNSKAETLKLLVEN